MDFDKSFADFVKSYITSSGADYDEIEDLVSSLSVEWSTLAQKELGGKSPMEYFADITDASEILGLLVRYAESGGVIPFILDRIALMNIAPQLLELASKTTDEIVLQYVLTLLIDKDAAPDSLLIDKLFTVSSDEIKSLIIEHLSGCADKVKDNLLGRAKNADIDHRMMVAEILANATQSDEIFDYLRTVYYDSGDLQFAVTVFTRYGDNRAVKIFKDITDATREQQLDIQNALEYFE